MEKDTKDKDIFETRIIKEVEAIQDEKKETRTGRIASYEQKKHMIRSMNDLMQTYACRYSEDEFFNSDEEVEFFLDVKEWTRNMPFQEAYKKVDHCLKSSKGKIASKFLPYIRASMKHISSSSYHDFLDDTILFMLFVEFQGTKRTKYSREIDRIQITKSFRHLQYKTQVMVNSASDDQRTRLLHTLEVQSIAKTLATQLGANWELAQAIAMGHDAGHSPFGHAGERALNRVLESCLCGGFSHALQSVKVLNDLEEHPVLKHYGIKGIGLSIETLSGILKHDSDAFIDDVSKPAFRLQYDCPEAIISYMPSSLEDEEDIYPVPKMGEITLGNIEAQIVFWSDKLAYLGHDWEEFSSSKFIEEMLQTINNIVGNLTRYVMYCNENQDTAELKLIRDIHDKIKKMNKLYDEEADSPEKKMEVQASLYIYISDLMHCKMKMNSELIPCTRISKVEYMTLFNYFEICKAWMKITERVPSKYKDSNDIVYIISNFFKKTLSQRITPSIHNELIRETRKRLHDKKYTARSFVLASQDQWNRNRSRSLNLTTEERKEQFRNDLILTLKTDGHMTYNNEMANTLRCVKLVNDYVMDYFISNTYVQNMTNKAEQIIEKLFFYFIDNPEMLPEKEIHRYCVEVEKDDSTYELILIQYLGDKLNEFSERVSAICTDFQSPTVDLHFANTTVSDAWDQLHKQARYQIEKVINDNGCSSFINNKAIPEKLKWQFVALCKIVESEGVCGHLPDRGRRYTVLFGDHNPKEDKDASPLLTDKNHRNKALLARIVADYIASMTDRMAVMKYDEITSAKSSWSTEYCE